MRADRSDRASDRPLGPIDPYSFTVRVRDAVGTIATAAYQLSVASGGPAPGDFPTTRVNAPSPRGEHTAVWTGTEMIVWGGATAARR